MVGPRWEPRRASLRRTRAADGGIVVWDGLAARPDLDEDVLVDGPPGPLCPESEALVGLVPCRSEALAGGAPPEERPGGGLPVPPEEDAGCGDEGSAEAGLADVPFARGSSGVIFVTSDPLPGPVVASSGEGRPARASAASGVTSAIRGVEPAGFGLPDRDGAAAGPERVGGVSVGPLAAAAAGAWDPEPVDVAWPSGDPPAGAGPPGSPGAGSGAEGAEGAEAVPAALVRDACASRLVPGCVAGPAVPSATVSVTASVDTTSPGTQPPLTSGRRSLLAERDAPVPRRTRWRQCIRHPFRTRP
nr:hypothetical protein GCM10010200_086610 [Actinomadura rugatobispora]